MTIEIKVSAARRAAFDLLWRVETEDAYASNLLASPRYDDLSREDHGLLQELTLGVLGMGRVGRRVGRIAALGFGMRVIYNDLLDVAPLLDFPAAAVDKPALYRESDVLSIHVDMRPGNANLVGREQLAVMKPGAILINASRGEVLDACGLADALRENRLAAAALSRLSKA